MFKTIEVNINDQESMKLFETFYQDSLLPNFDNNQIETYEQFINTLSDNSKKSIYNILLIIDNNYPIGGIIFDYFTESNTGFIEYIVTNKDVRQKGIGTYLLNEASKKLNALAKEYKFDRINFIACEVEQEDNEKKAKHYFWQKFGFRKLDFYYVQPPLDNTKDVVDNMDFGIITEAPNAKYDKDYVEKELIKSLLEVYYEKYKDNTYYLDMMKCLEEHDNKIELI